MTIAALLAFGTLLAAWLAAPAERRRPANTTPEPLHNLTTEPRAA